MYKPVTDFYKQHLGKKIEKVSVSNKLVDAPLFVFTSQYGYSAQMEKNQQGAGLRKLGKGPQLHAGKEDARD